MSAPLELGLLGHPVAHSVSPAIHRAALAGSGLEGRYRLFDVSEAELPSWVERLRRGEVDGLNVTIPHKGAAAALCDGLEGVARRLGVVNTLTRDGEGGVVGANTDVSGLSRALTVAFPSAPLAGSPVAILGAGGAAHAAVMAAAALDPSEIRVTNRHPERARLLVGRLSKLTEIPLVVSSSPEDAARGAALLLQATPSGMGLQPSSPSWRRVYREARPVVAALAPEAVVMDLVYRPSRSAWCAAASDAERPSEGGLMMLVYQALEAFERWTGRAVEAAPLFTAAREALGL